MVRRATSADVEDIMKIYEAAKEIMRVSGNMTQWVNGYPSQELIQQDIKKKQAYVYEYQGEVHGVFILQCGEDATYSKIEGAWLNSEPYVTIHRIASDGKVKGVFQNCIDYSKMQCKNIRIDTHGNNHIMQKLCEKGGFQYCGIIYIEDGSPRMAYQYVGENE